MYQEGSSQQQVRDHKQATNKTAQKELKGIGNAFLNRTMVTSALKTMDKWKLRKLKSSFTAKDAITSVKRRSTEWGKSSPAKYLTDG